MDRRSDLLLVALLVAFSSLSCIRSSSEEAAVDCTALG
jgi:hypothetical protein